MAYSYNWSLTCIWRSYGRRQFCNARLRPFRECHLEGLRTNRGVLAHIDITELGLDLVVFVEISPTSKCLGITQISAFLPGTGRSTVFSPRLGSAGTGLLGDPLRPSRYVANLVGTSPIGLRLQFHCHQARQQSD